MNTTTCPLCDFARAEEQTYADTIQREGRKVTVQNLRHFVCPKCESVFVNDEQSRHNLRTTQSAFGEEPKFLCPEDIRAWRTDLGITQRDLAKILGGGLNAFSKYENGEIIQSEAMDNLLWLVMRHPRLLIDLAERRKHSLPETIAAKCRAALQHAAVETWSGSLEVAAATLLFSLEPMPHHYWPGHGTFFIDGSWSQRRITFSHDDVSVANNDGGIRFAQLA